MWIVVTNKLKKSINLLGRVECVNRNITTDNRIFYVFRSKVSALDAAVELRKINMGKSIRVYVRHVSAANYKNSAYYT